MIDRAVILRWAFVAVMVLANAVVAPASGPSAPPTTDGDTPRPARVFTKPVGRVWAVIQTTSGAGPRGLSPWWEKPGAEGQDWTKEFAGVERTCIDAPGFGPARGVARIATGAATRATGADARPATLPPPIGDGYDEIMIYRPWGIEDHTDKAMHFDALPRARARLEMLERAGVTQASAGTARALRRLVDTDAFIDGARKAQDKFGKPFWYYFGACLDPALKSKSMSELQAWAEQSCEPVLVVGGNIIIDSAGITNAASTEWALALTLRRMGMKQIGCEPAAHTIVPTNNDALRGGSAQFTPWALDPSIVGLITGSLFQNRWEWRSPTALNDAEQKQNARAWLVPLEQTAGEMVIWEYRDGTATREWLVERLAEGYSVMVNPGQIEKAGLTPRELREAATRRRAELTGGAR